MQGARRFTGSRSRLPDAEFQRLIEEALGRHNLSDVIGQYTKLKRSGRSEMMGLCPFHQERTPSFGVNDAKGTYYCHGCGAAGNALIFLMTRGGLPFGEAYEALAGDRFPTVSEEERAQRREEDERERREAIDWARRFWNSTVPIAGTLAEIYLRSRGIVMPVPASFRFARVPLSRDDAGNWRAPMPALIGAVSVGAELVAIQRIFLRDDGTDKRWRKPRRSKFSLGRPKGGALRLDHGIEGSEVIITEGPEDALSLAQELPGRRVWAALGTAMMPALAFPDDVDSIVIAGQNDAAGRAAVDAAGEALLERGFAVRTTYPRPEFKDWNDQLRGVRQ